MLVLAIQESRMLVELDHPRVLRYYGLYEDDTGVYIVTDLCEGYGTGAWVCNGGLPCGC